MFTFKKYVHVNVHVFVHVLVHVYVHEYVYVNVCVYVYVFEYVFAHVYVYACVKLNEHVYVDERFSILFLELTKPRSTSLRSGHAFHDLPLKLQHAI